LLSVYQFNANLIFVVLPQMTLLQCLAGLNRHGFLEHLRILTDSCNAITPGNFEPLAMFVARQFKPSPMSIQLSDSIFHLLCVYFLFCLQILV
jgi:hypothetical protein